MPGPEKVSFATDMFAALLTTLLFSISAICGHRTSTRLGGVEANFWRIVGALAVPGSLGKHLRAPAPAARRFPFLS